MRKSFEAEVKCRLPWPESAEDDLPVCQNLTQYTHFERLYAEINVVSTNSIENVTRCMRPCHYKEYRMEDIPGTISKKPENFSSTYCLLVCVDGDQCGGAGSCLPMAIAGTLHIISSQGSN